MNVLEKSRKVLRLVCVFLLMVSLACGGYLIFCKLVSYEENEKIYTHVRELAFAADTNADTNKKDNGSGKSRRGVIDWDSLKEYPIVAWIKCGAEIDYPVVQGEDNSYYLKHSYDGTYNMNGAIFVNSENQADFSDWNTVIYGHNMRSGKMFGTIKKYADPDYGADQFYIYLPDGTEHIYQIFAVAEVKDGSAAYLYTFSDKEDYCSYQQYVKECAYYDTGLEPDADRKMVTLSTCRSTGSAQGWRVIIVGREIACKQVQ